MFCRLNFFFQVQFVEEDVVRGKGAAKTNALFFALTNENPSKSIRGITFLVAAEHLIPNISEKTKAIICTEQKYRQLMWQDFASRFAQISPDPSRTMKNLKGTNEVSQVEDFGKLASDLRCTTGGIPLYVRAMEDVTVQKYQNFLAAINVSAEHQATFLDEIKLEFGEFRMQVDRALASTRNEGVVWLKVMESSESV